MDKPMRDRFDCTIKSLAMRAVTAMLEEALPERDAEEWDFALRPEDRKGANRLGGVEDDAQGDNMQVGPAAEPQDRASSPLSDLPPSDPLQAEEDMNEQGIEADDDNEADGDFDEDRQSSDGEDDEDEEDGDYDDTMHA